MSSTGCSVFVSVPRNWRDTSWSPRVRSVPVLRFGFARGELEYGKSGVPARRTKGSFEYFVYATGACLVLMARCDAVSGDRSFIGRVTCDASLREKIVSHQFENLSQQNRILSPPVFFFF